MTWKAEPRKVKRLVPEDAKSIEDGVALPAWSARELAKKDSARVVDNVIKRLVIHRFEADLALQRYR